MTTNPDSSNMLPITFSMADVDIGDKRAVPHCNGYPAADYRRVSLYEGFTTWSERVEVTNMPAFVCRDCGAVVTDGRANIVYDTRIRAARRAGMGDQVLQKNLDDLEKSRR